MSDYSRTQKIINKMFGFYCDSNHTLNAELQEFASEIREEEQSKKAVAPSVNLGELAEETAEKLRMNRENIIGGYDERSESPVYIIKSALLKARGEVV